MSYCDAIELQSKQVESSLHLPLERMQLSANGNYFLTRTPIDVGTKGEVG